jgi:lipoprotein-releasing system permease protein
MITEKKKVPRIRLGYEIFISGRYLRSRQKQAFISLITFLSIAGVTVGVMALMIVIAVMTGFESDLKNRILGVESHLEVLHHGSPFTDYREAMKYISTLNGVLGATPIVAGQVMIRSAVGVSGALVRGIDPTTAASVINNLDGGQLEQLAAMNQSDREAPGIILGKQLALSLGVSLGDTIYLISPGGMLSPVGHVPVMKRFAVIGWFESGIYDYDGSMAFIHLSEAQRMVRLSDAVQSIDIKLKDIYAAKQMGELIVSHLGYPYWFRTWMQKNQPLFSALKLEKTVMFIILTLIVLVAAFNIASTLIMMVMEKTKDIAILKAMGASDGSIRKIFVYKGMVIGLVGTVLGLTFGFILCALLKKYQFIELPGDVYYLTKLPVLLRWTDTIMIAAATLVICFIATLYPACRAARLDPVEAIRYG